MWVLFLARGFFLLFPLHPLEASLSLSLYVRMTCWIVTTLEAHSARTVPCRTEASGPPPHPAERWRGCPRVPVRSASAGTRPQDTMGLPRNGWWGGARGSADRQSGLAVAWSVWVWGSSLSAPDPRRSPVRHGGCKRGKGPKVAGRGEDL